MSFPASPTNGQTTTIGGIVYIYSTANSSWTRSAGGAASGIRSAYYSTVGTGFTFTIPSGVTSIKVTAIGGGGGGADQASGGGDGGGSGGDGGGAVKYITGLTPGLTLTVNVGAGGAMGYNAGGAPGNGGAGGASSVASGTQTITTVQGGGGGGGAGGSVGGASGSGGTATGVTNAANGSGGYSFAGLGRYMFGLGMGGSGTNSGSGGGGRTPGTQGCVLIEY